MKKVLAYSLPLAIPVTSLIAIDMGSWWVLFGFIFSFGIHPLLDYFSGIDEDMADPNDTMGKWFSSILWLYVPLQLFFLVTVLMLCSFDSYNTFELIGIILSTGAITGGLGITIAHELVHRRARWERGLGVALLAMVNYSHFRVEHVFGHHKHVATPHDPASARKGETIFPFLVRSIIGSFKSAWKIEAKRPLKKNRMVHYIVTAIVLAAAVYAAFGWMSLIVYFGQSLIAIMTLEAINYIEHYGLERKEIRPGVYEPVTEAHSWDSGARFTNWFLFNLGRHAHHHSEPTVPYQKLRVSKDANHLKYGYSTEILLAFVGLNTRK